jgi:hypothetical protein
MIYARHKTELEICIKVDISLHTAISLLCPHARIGRLHKRKEEHSLEPESSLPF